MVVGGKNLRRLPRRGIVLLFSLQDSKKSIGEYRRTEIV
jgi:hypothetical protein